MNTTRTETKTPADATLRNIFCGLDDEELADRYSDDECPETERAMILSEMARRDRKAAQTKRDKARWAAVYAEWALAAHAQYLQAEAVCCGNLVDKHHLDDVSDPASLWTGSERWAMRVATEELRDFWALHPRMTVSQFRAGLRAAKRDAREQYADAA